MINSEDIEATMAKIVGELFARCEAAKASGDQYKIISACSHFWYGMKGLEHIAIALRNVSENDSQCLHFSMVMVNHMQDVHRYIEKLTGLNPDEQPDWH